MYSRNAYATKPSAQTADGWSTVTNKSTGRSARGYTPAKSSLRPGARKSATTLKEACKEALAVQCTDISKITDNDVMSIVSAVCGKMKDVDANVVLPTVLAIVLKEIALMETGRAALIESLASIIKDIMKSGREQKSATGYQLLNTFCWPGCEVLKNPEDYVQAVEALINVCSCDVLAHNDKGETALLSYLHAIERKMAPMIAELKDLLTVGIRMESLTKMIRSMVNKLTAQSISSQANIFKLAFCLNPDLLVKMCVENLFALYAFSKKDGKFEFVSNYVDVYKAAFDHPILDDEWKTCLTMKFKDPSANFSSFLGACADYAVSVYESKQMEIEVKMKEIKDAGGNPNDACACIAIDIIGALVGESSAILKTPLYSRFIVSMFQNIKSEYNQNQVMVSTCHLLGRLGKMKTPKHEAIKIITRQTLEILSASAKNNEVKLHTRIITILEKGFKNFFEITIRAENLPSLVAKFPEPKVPAKDKKAIKATKVATAAKIAAATKFGAFGLLEDDESEPETDSETETENDDDDDDDDEAAVSTPTDIDLSTVIDLDAGSRIAPSFLRTIKIGDVHKISGDWNNDHVGDWVYSRQKDASVKAYEISAIAGMLVKISDVSITAGNSSDELFKLCKLIIDDALTEKMITATFKTLKASLTPSNTEDFQYFWETPKGFTHFQKLAALYDFDF